MPIQLSGSGSITGVSTLTSLASLDVAGSVSVGGTLIYDDVTNIDSIGIVTARSDVHVGSALSVTGISTFGNGLHVTSGQVLVAKTTTSITTQGSRVDNGLITVSGNSNSTNLAVNSGGNLSLANIDSTDNNFSNIGGYNSNGLVVSQIDFINKSHSSRTGDIAFLTHNGSAMSERLRITSAGNIGVGGATGTDYSLLDGIVTNTANGSAGLLINSSSSSHNAYMSFGYGSGSGTSHADQFSAYIGRVGDDNLILGTNNNIRVSIDSTGRLLKSGQAALNSTSLSHPIQVASASDANAIAIIGRAADDIGELSFYEADKTTKLGELQYRQDHLNLRCRVGDIRFASGGTLETLRIDGSGRIAQGGKTPTNHGSPNLLLWGADPTMMIASTGSTANTSYTGIKFAVAGGSTGDYSKAGIFVQRQDSYNDLDMIFAFRSTNDAAGVAISDEKLRINSDGHVGINETSPATHLHVEQDNAHSSTYYLNSDAAILVDNKNASGKSVIKLEHDAAIVWGGSGDSILFSDRESERLRINEYGNTIFQGQAGGFSNGNTGNAAILVRGKSVSGSSTTVDLNISQATSASGVGLEIQESTNSANALATLVFNHGSLKSMIACSRVVTNQWGTDLRFYTHPPDTSSANQHKVYERMRIDPDGRVGIKNVSPSENLHIDGAFKQDGHSNNVQYYQMCFTLPSGTTSTMFTLSGTGQDATAMAVLEYVALYSYASNNHEAGIKYASTRRINSNSAWNDIDDIAVNQAGNSSGIRPTLFWDNGVLKITSGGSVQITGTLRLTTRRFTVSRNFNAG